MTEPSAQSVSAAEPAADVRRQGRGLPLGFAVLVGGLAWWPVGFAAWLFGRANTTAVALSAPVPLLAAEAPLLLSCSLIGSALSAWLLRVCRGALLARVLLGLLGLLIAVVATCGLSAAAARMVATDSISQSRLVSAGLAAIVLAVSGLGWLVGLLALAGRSGWTAPAAGIAVLLPGWTSVLIGRNVSLDGWLLAVLLGVVLGVSAFRSKLALLWWVPALLLAWFTVSAVTASAYTQQLIPGLSQRGNLLSEAFDEVLLPALQVFVLSSGPASRELAPWLEALALGLLGLLLGRLGLFVRVRRSRPSS